MIFLLKWQKFIGQMQIAVAESLTFMGALEPRPATFLRGLAPLIFVTMRGFTFDALTRDRVNQLDLLSLDSRLATVYSSTPTCDYGFTVLYRKA